MATDRFWTETAGFLTERGAVARRTLAPSEFGPLLPGAQPYERLGSDPLELFRWIVVHKGMLDRLGRSLLEKVNAEFHPVFANEVFVVLAREAGAGEPPDPRHVDAYHRMLRDLPELPRTAAAGSLEESLAGLLRPVDERKHPNLNPLWEVTRNLPVLHRNVKFLGYLLADAQRRATPEEPVPEPQDLDLGWKACTQADVDSPWLWHWCQELKTRALYHRKLWEFAYVLQALHQGGWLREGARGIGFGCGTEPLPSYLASRGVEVTVTDLPAEDERAQPWSSTDQLATSLEACWEELLVDRESFRRRVSLEFVDMTRLPASLEGRYDFCWSICAMEHLGSLEAGLRFVEESLRVLRPGGLAVHTTEYSYLRDEPIDDWCTVYFQGRHLEDLRSRLERAGHRVGALDLDPGSGPMDLFVDVPPFSWDEDFPHEQLRESLFPWKGYRGNKEQHLKFSIDGIASTCFGLSVGKRA